MKTLTTILMILTLAGCAHPRSPTEQYKEELCEKVTADLEDSFSEYKKCMREFEE